MYMYVYNYNMWKQMFLFIWYVKTDRKTFSILSFWVKPWLQHRSAKSAYHSIISELKLQERHNYWKYFSMNM